MSAQAQLEAELLTKDIRVLTETINWMVGQGIEVKAIAEVQTKREVLIRARDQFLVA